MWTARTARFFSRQPSRPLLIILPGRRGGGGSGFRKHRDLIRFDMASRRQATSAARVGSPVLAQAQGNRCRVKTIVIRAHLLVGNDRRALWLPEVATAAKDWRRRFNAHFDFVMAYSI